MGKVVKIAAIFLLIILSVPSWAQKKSKEEKQQLYEQAVKLIENGEYEFIAEWAYTQKGRQVNLMSNPNFLRVVEQEATAELPYFGVITSGSAAYGGDSGIAVKGEMTKYSLLKKDKKLRVIIKFSVRKATELLDFTLTVNGPESTTLVVTSSVRQSIRYVGKLKE